MKETFYSWNEYSFRFKQKAQVHNISDDVVLGLLSYSKNLSDNKLPIIYDLKHLSYLTGYRDLYILRAIRKPSNFYRTFKIPKKNGDSREITEPLPGLKAIQYWILTNIIETVPMNKFNNAYAKGKSIVSNAKYHTKQPMVLNMDIEKYFDNISYELVLNFFTNLGYNKDVSRTLSQLCTLNDGLPQGSPSSPLLSSILTVEIDNQLFDYCRNWNLRYSRYADDITISGDFHAGTIISGAREIIEKNNFSINKSKTRVKRQHQRQMVTGIVVNKKLSIKNSELKQIRQSLYYINKFGIESHAERIELNKSNYIQHLLGKINFFLFVKKKNIELTKYKQILIDILKASETD